MKKSRLTRAHRDEPPPLTTCLAVSAICSVAIFIFLLVFFPISKYAPGTQEVLFVVFTICFVGTMIWRCRRYGFYMTQAEFRKATGRNPEKRLLKRRIRVEPMPATNGCIETSRGRLRSTEQVRGSGKTVTFFRFNLSHMLFIVAAVGISGWVLSRGAYLGILRTLTPRSIYLLSFENGWRVDGTLFTERPVALMVFMVLSSAIGLAFSCALARIGEARGWSARKVNLLVILMAALVLPIYLFSGLALMENIVVGLCMLTVTIWGTILGWRMVCGVLGGNAPERRRRLVKRRSKVAAPAQPAPVPGTGKPAPRPYRASWLHARVPRCGHYRMNP